MNYIGLNIKKIREHWGLSQEEFGSLINASRGMIMTYEVRGSMPRADRVSGISKLTGIPRTKLLTTELRDDEIPALPTPIQELINKAKSYPNNISEEDLQLKINSAIGIIALLYNNRIASQIRSIIQPGLLAPMSAKEQLGKVVEVIIMNKLREGSSIIEDLRHKFHLSFLHAYSVRNAVEELKLLDVRHQIHRSDKQIKEEIEKCEDDVSYHMGELWKIIMPESERTDLFRTMPKSPPQEEIDFFYVFDRLVIKEKDAISQINSPSDKKVVRHFFQGGLPEEIDDLKTHYPIPFFDTISPTLLSDLSSDNLQNAMDDFPFQLVIVPDITDADFAIEAIGHNMTSRIKNGDIVICKYIPTDDTWSYVKYGQTYLAFCDDEPVICSIKEGKYEDKLLFYSVNPDYSSYEMPKTRIKAICLIKSIITRSPL